MALLTFKEWVEDRKKQLSECPCNDCKYRIDHDSPNHVSINNDWEPLYPREYPLSFACVWKRGWLDTKVMRNKECLYKNRSDMIFTKDIQIGDWLYFAERDKKHLFEVTNVDSKGILGGYLLRDNSRIKINNVSETNFEPIFLTGEILKKNNFTFVKNTGAYVGLFLCLQYNGFIEVSLFHVGSEYDNTQLHISDSNDTTTVIHLMECKYVHQLQHALRICQIRTEINL